MDNNIFNEFDNIIEEASIPYDIKTSQLIKALSRLGFQLQNTAGDHYKLKDSKGRIFPVPRHNITKTSLIKTGLKRLEIPFDQFMSVLNSVNLDEDSENILD